jgi:RimJ/RimL family protein N-acetyltransferase
MQIKQGKTINFRLVEVTDAEFIFGLRMNPQYNSHLSKAMGTILDQVLWIEKYKEREMAGNEYYFVIEKRGLDIPIGTVRLYDFLANKESFCWGSWILSENKGVSSAIECALIIYDFAFNSLEFKSSHFDVRKDNEKVISFHEKCGAIRVGDDEKNIYFNLSREGYSSFYKQFNKYLVNEND